MIDQRRFSLVKPTIDTPFHIDFEWWKQHDANWRVFLHSCLCPEHQLAFSDLSDTGTIDWVDPETAEIQMVDGLQLVLMTHCAKLPDFVTPQTILVDAVFRILLSSGNNPMSIKEIAEITGKSADTILRTLTGGQVYKGLRPCH